MSDNVTKALQQKFAIAFEKDDRDLLFTLLHPDCEWVIKATGETFHGLERIGWMVATVAGAREHTEQAQLTITNSFAGGDCFCIELINRGVLKKSFPGASVAHPEKGQVFEMNFCVTAHITDGTIDRVHEYYDLDQFATPPERRRKIFS